VERGVPHLLAGDGVVEEHASHQFGVDVFVDLDDEEGEDAEDCEDGEQASPVGALGQLVGSLLEDIEFAHFVPETHPANYKWSNISLSTTTCTRRTNRKEPANSSNAGSTKSISFPKIHTQILEGRG
jgi:hypothetical protein